MTYQLQKQNQLVQQNVQEINSLEEFENCLKELQKGASESLSSALNAQLQIVQYIQSPKLIDSSFDLFFANLRKSIKYTPNSVQKENVQERAQLMIHNFVFFLQAKLDYMIEGHSVAGKEILTKATENIIGSIQDLLKNEGGTLLMLNKQVLVANIVSKFDQNFIQKVCNYFFGGSRIERKYGELMQTLELLFTKFERHKNLIGKSDIILELIHRYRKEVVHYRNRNALALFSEGNLWGFVIGFLIVWSILFMIGYYVSGSYVDYSIPENKKIISIIGWSGCFIPFYIYLLIRLRMFFQSMKYKRLAKSFYPADDDL